MKVYRVAIIDGGQDNGNGLDYSGPDARAALDAALYCAEYNVRRGLHMRVTCGDELVWDSKIEPIPS